MMLPPGVTEKPSPRVQAAYRTCYTQSQTWRHKIFSAKGRQANMLLYMCMLLAGLNHVLASPLYKKFSYVGPSLEAGVTQKYEIREKPCTGGKGDVVGECLFNFQCVHRKGTVIGTCIDGFLFGVCCDVSEGDFNNVIKTTSSTTEKNVEQVTDHKFIIPHVPSPERDHFFLTKTKPDNSVLLYTVDIFNNDEDNIAGLPNTSIEKTMVDVEENLEKNEGVSMSTVLHIPESLYNNTGSSKIPPVILDIKNSNSKSTTADREVLSGSTSSSRLETSTEPLLLWTLGSQTSMKSTKPAKNTVTVSSSSDFPTISDSKNGITAFMTVPKKTDQTTTPITSLNTDESVEGTQTSYFIQDENHNDKQETSLSELTRPLLPNFPNVLDNSTPAYNDGDITTVNLSDPLAVWTTMRPQKRPVLQTMSSLSSSVVTTDNLLFWTTAKPKLRPRPTVSTTTVPTTTTEKSKPSGLLIPNNPSNSMPDVFSADQIIDNLINSMTEELKKESSSTELPTTNTQSWATSTYAIFPHAFDISHNIVNVDSGNKKPSEIDETTITDGSSFTTSYSTISESDNVFNDYDPFDTRITTEESRDPEIESITESSETTTSVQAGETTPIDEFIENLLNSLIHSNSTTAPPIDLDLIQQMLSGDASHLDDELELPDISSISALTEIDMVDEDPSDATPSTEVVTKPFTNPPQRTTTSTTTSTTSFSSTTTTTPTSTSTITTTTTMPTTTTTSTTTMKQWDWKTTCGVRPLSTSRTGRIVNGRVSGFGDWPWQVLVRESTWLGLFSKNKCGGVLLNEKYVLTAAHCKPGFLASLVVVLGDVDLSNNYEPRQPIEKNVKRVIVHRDYVARTFDNDLALLELASPVKFDEHILPICLPKDDSDDFVGDMGTVTGWGRLNYGGPVPDRLQVVDLPVVSNSECQSWFREAGHRKNIKPEFMCAGYKSGVKDSCEGDSGGPLSVQGRDGRWVLAGTVSHGIKCAYPNLPGVYMRMSYYKPWIENIINS